MLSIKTDLNAVVTETCNYLSVPDQEKFLKLLTKFQDLFDGTLGDSDTQHLSLVLKEGAKSYHGRPFPTSKPTKSGNQNQNGLCLHLQVQNRTKLHDLLVILGK